MKIGISIVIDTEKEDGGVVVVTPGDDKSVTVPLLNLGEDESSLIEHSYSDEPVTPEELREWDGLWGYPTEREETVTELVMSGMSNLQIAELLNLSVRTVESHRANAMSKLGANGRYDYVTKAFFFWGLRSRQELATNESS